MLSYGCKTLVEQENALKEIALLVFSRSGFFKVAAFQGGTCLRILYGLERFSEDLNFVLESPDKNFEWARYVNAMREEFRAYGYLLELEHRCDQDKVIKTAFLKEDSKGGLLVLKDSRTHRAKIKIKLEIDTNPPAGSLYEFKYLDFPLPYDIKTQDLTNLFAGKCHTLLCRNFIKGRDWFDFIWYIARLTKINFGLLSSAIAQAGPWKDQNIAATPLWLIQQLETKVNNIDWEMAKRDVSLFLRPKELSTLYLWSTAFFLSRLEKLSYLPL